MIQTETRLKIIDNSGGKEALCIGILGGSGHKEASVGDTIVVSIKKASPSSAKSKVQRKEVHRAVIVGTKKRILREDGTSIRFDSNSCVIVDENGVPKGTRVMGPVARELRKKKHMKIISLSLKVI